jgi:hypothetical protein
MRGDAIAVLITGMLPDMGTLHLFIGRYIMRVLFT